MPPSRSGSGRKAPKASQTKGSTRSHGVKRGGGARRHPQARTGTPNLPGVPLRAAPSTQRSRSLVTSASYSLEVGSREISANRRRARAICATGALGPAAIVGIGAGIGLGTIAAVVIAVVVFVGVAVGIWQGASRLVVRLIHATPLAPGTAPMLTNMVDGLCPTFGVRVPSLMVIDDAVPNACSFGRGSSHVRLVVTTGLLDRLGVIELEGVIGHELAHVKRHDTVVSAVAVAVLAPIVWVTGRDDWVHRALGRGREYRADEIAAAAVRYPPGLRDALAAMQNGPVPAPGSVFTGRSLAITRWLWVDPSIGRRDQHRLGDLDASDVRIAVLDEW